MPRVTGLLVPFGAALAQLSLVALASCGQTASPEGPAAAGRGERPVIGGQETWTPTIGGTTPPASTAPGPTTEVDASVPDAKPKPTPDTAKECFKALEGAIPGPDYDQFGLKVGKNCSGTKTQTIDAVERLVFLGDSVTTGTPPTAPGDFYWTRLADAVKQKFGAGVQVENCSGWGAQIDDLLENDKQIEKCFKTGVEPKKTLIVMTMGGNDIHGWMNDKLTEQQALAAADVSIQKMSDALHWLKDPAHFPNGSNVVFANVYEYTDTSGDLTSCPTASITGVSGTWKEGTKAVVHLQQEFMRLAKETGSDMVFLLESFCGHGYRRNDPSLQCYRGPNAELWFDLTCIHPTPKGHEVIANLFKDVIIP